MELTGVQELYVKVCREKDELCRQLEGKSEGVPSEGVMKEREEKKKATIAAALQEVCLCTVIHCLGNKRYTTFSKRIPQLQKQASISF